MNIGRVADIRVQVLRITLEICSYFSLELNSGVTMRTVFLYWHSGCLIVSVLGLILIIGKMLLTVTHFM
jgi:hypothetical protein